MTSWRITATTALASASLAVAVLSVALWRDTPGTPFGPGELDVLFAARSMAASAPAAKTGSWVGAQL